MMDYTRNTGLVLSGAAAKGPFHAGVYSVLAEKKVPITRLAGASAGALSAVVIAAGIATGKLSYAAEVGRKVWLERASWGDILDVSVRDVFAGRGLSTTKKVAAIVEQAIRDVLGADVAPDVEPNENVLCKLALTSLTPQREATHEASLGFYGVAFREGYIARIAQAAAASSAIPGFFAPVEVEGEWMVDGGVCDNAPVSFVTKSDVHQAIVVSSYTPKRLETAPAGMTLVTDLLSIVVNERLLRDLEDRRNAGMDLLEIRPQVALEGSELDGFGSRRLRESYFDSGRKSALLRMVKS